MTELSLSLFLSLSPSLSLSHHVLSSNLRIGYINGFDGFVPDILDGCLQDRTLVLTHVPNYVKVPEMIKNSINIYCGSAECGAIPQDLW